MSFIMGTEELEGKDKEESEEEKGKTGFDRGVRKLYPEQPLFYLGLEQGVGQSGSNVGGCSMSAARCGRITQLPYSTCTLREVDSSRHRLHASAPLSPAR